MVATQPKAVQPLTPFLKIGAEGRPFLEGLKCAACGEVIVAEPRRACPKCATQGSLHPARLAETGKLYSYTIVYRSFPGVATPFVSALVDLDGGGTLKGNMRECDPEKLQFDMRVRIEFDYVDLPERPETRLLRYVFVGDQSAARS